MRLLPAVASLAVALHSAGAGPVLAQMDSREAIALQNQILELRRDLQALQYQRDAPQYPRGAPVPIAPQVRGYPQGGAYPGHPGGGGEIATQLLDRVTTLEEEVRRLRGQLDEQANQSRRRDDELNKQVGDLAFRLQQAGAGTAAPSAPGPSAPAEPRAASPRRTPELAMQEGNAALARRDYAAAEAAAREVLAAGRGAPRAADAHFLLAQALAGRRDHQAAALAFDEAYNRSRTGSRAPEALLGLANSLVALNERPAACATLDKLRAEFPDARAGVRDAAAAARGRAGCR